MTETKPWYLSKTLWFNVIVALLALAETQSALLAQVVPPALYPYVALTVAGINIVLRIVTASGLTVK